MEQLQLVFTVKLTWRAGAEGTSVNIWEYHKSQIVIIKIYLGSIVTYQVQGGQILDKVNKYK